MGYADMLLWGGIMLSVLIPLIVITVVAYLLGKLIGGKGEKKTRFLCIFISVINILISAIGFISNIGWIRIVLLMFLLPLWYSFLLLLSSASVPTVIKKSKAIYAAYIVSNVCFLASGLVLPDGGDTGGGYMFFGLLDYSPDYLISISAWLFFVSIAAMIFQLVSVRVIKKKLGLM